MGMGKLVHQFAILCVLLALLAGCAPAATPTPTSVPTDTPIPPTATPEPTPETPEWDYVALGHSHAWWKPGYVDPYADHIRSDLGVRVKVHRRAIPG